MVLFRVNDVNTSLGQLGFALLKNLTENTSKLILYKTKEQILSTLLLSKSSKVYWRPPYLQYHDDVNEFWSLLFGSDTDSNEFLCCIDRDNIEKEKKIEATSSKLSEIVETPKDKVDGTDIIIPASAKAKSDVVYRVAKIGHQLPKINPVADDDSDSTLPSDTEKSSIMQSIKSINNIPGNLQEKPIDIVSTQIPPKSANISVAVQPSFLSSSTFDLNSLATENRIQHTEVRMNLSKLDTKLDRILDNIERKYLIEYEIEHTKL